MYVNKTVCQWSRQFQQNELFISCFESKFSQQIPSKFFDEIMITFAFLKLEFWDFGT